MVPEFRVKLRRLTDRLAQPRRLLKGRGKSLVGLHPCCLGKRTREFIDGRHLLRRFCWEQRLDKRSHLDARQRKRPAFRLTLAATRDRRGRKGSRKQARYFGGDFTWIRSAFGLNLLQGSTDSFDDRLSPNAPATITCAIPSATCPV